jgi:hypothetical protein
MTGRSNKGSLELALHLPGDSQVELAILGVFALLQNDEVMRPRQLCHQWRLTIRVERSGTASSSFACRRVSRFPSGFSAAEYWGCRPSGPRSRHRGCCCAGPPDQLADGREPDIYGRGAEILFEHGGAALHEDGARDPPGRGGRTGQRARPGLRVVAPGVGGDYGVLASSATGPPRPGRDRPIPCPGAELANPV